MKIKVKYHDPNLEKLAAIKQGDWIDLRSAEDVAMVRGAHCLISLGVSMKLPDGYEAHIAPRSSTFRNWGIIQTNGVGVVDNSYCGENDIWKMPVYATRSAKIKRGDRICQFRLVKKMDPVDFVEVEHMEDSDRGGFGSTGTA